MWGSRCAKEEQFSVIYSWLLKSLKSSSGFVCNGRGHVVSQVGEQTTIARTGFDLILSPLSLSTHSCRVSVGFGSLPLVTLGLHRRWLSKDKRSPGHPQHHCCRAAAFILSWRPSLVSLKIRHATLIVLVRRKFGDLNGLVSKQGGMTVRHGAHLREKYVIGWFSPLGFHGKEQCRICTSVVTHYSISFPI